MMPDEPKKYFVKLFRYKRGGDAEEIIVIPFIPAKIDGHGWELKPKNGLELDIIAE
jgi:hypothetical protein